MITPKDKVERVEQLLATTNASMLEISAVTDVHVATVRLIRNGDHLHQQSLDEQDRRLKGEARAYTPTPAEIEAACRRIRRKAPRRPVHTPPPYEFPTASARVIVQ